MQENLFSKIYFTLFIALGISAMTSYVMVTYYVNQLIKLSVSSPALLWIVWIVELILVAIISMMQAKDSIASPILLIVYSILNGFAISYTLMIYDIGSILLALSATSITYLIAAIFGSMTKMNLSGAGKFASITLIGVIVTMLLNIFIFKSSGLDLFLSFLTIVAVTAFVARDNQRIQQIQNSGRNVGIGLICSLALSIYLSIMNLFLSFLRLSSKIRN